LSAIYNDKMMTKKSQNSQPLFLCQKCDYSTSRINDFNKHKMTRKHQNDDKMMTKNSQNSQDDNFPFFKCECGNAYASRQGLFVHKKKCCQLICKNNEDKLMDYLIKENSELKQMILDVCKNVSISNSFNNSNNKTFNLNMFLNETCKDAMNIMEFVDSLQLQLSDLEDIGRNGYVNGISNIIIKNLKALDVEKRPVHCTDVKREIIYIKDDNKWEKDNDEKKHLRKAIKYIAHKNSKLIPEFREKYPDCNKSHSKYAEQYNKLVIEAMGGFGDNDKEKEDKIIKNIAKEITIDKLKY